jgi:hypothetical protein
VELSHHKKTLQNPHLLASSHFFFCQWLWYVTIGCVTFIFLLLELHPLKGGIHYRAPFFHYLWFYFSMFNLTSPDIMLSSFLWIDVFVSSWLIILILHFYFIKLKPFCIVLYYYIYCTLCWSFCYGLKWVLGLHGN